MGTFNFISAIHHSFGIRIPPQEKQKVPRKKISDGIPLAIYKRCGWEQPDSNMTEKEELGKRRQFAIDNGASEQAMIVLDQLCKNYENKQGTLK